MCGDILYRILFPVTYKQVSVPSDTLVMRRITKRTKLGWWENEPTSNSLKRVSDVILHYRGDLTGFSQASSHSESRLSLNVPP